MKVEIKDKATIKNLQYLSSIKDKNGKVATATEIVESALALFFSAINERAERLKKGN